MATSIPESEMAVLTPEEEAEFTPVSAVAFDLLRVESEKMGQRPPVWLCCSAEVKREYLTKVTWMMKGTLNLAITCSDEEVAERLAPLVRGETIDQWKSVERHYKWLREQGNPQAFFT